MGLWAIYQKPRSTLPGKPSEPYSLPVDFRVVTALDHVWATDITYCPTAQAVPVPSGYHACPL
jgi:putative transposase